MSLRYLRKILSVVLSCMIALGTTALFGFLLVHATVCSESYVSRFVDSNEVSAERKAAFNKRVEALEAKSGIPVRVFDAVYNFSEITDDTAIHRVYSGFDSQLYNEATIDRFEKLCKEYLDGTGTQYDEILIRNTAIEAAEIYSDCFGLKNTQELISFINSFEQDLQTYASLAVILIIFPAVLIFIMFKKADSIFINLLPGFIASGLTLFITGVCGLLFRFGQGAVITPAVYATAFGNAVKGMFVITLFCGAVLSIGCLILHIYVIEKSKEYN